MSNEDYAEKLVRAHWSYIEGLLRVHSEEPEIIELVRYYYQTAFLHGFKHAETYYKDKAKSENKERIANPRKGEYQRNYDKKRK